MYTRAIVKSHQMQTPLYHFQHIVIKWKPTTKLILVRKKLRLILKIISLKVLFTICRSSAQKNVYNLLTKIKGQYFSNHNSLLFILQFQCKEMLLNGLRKMCINCYVWSVNKVFFTQRYSNCLDSYFLRNSNWYGFTFHVARQVVVGC